MISFPVLYVICTIIGICSVVAWNVWITTPTYFTTKVDPYYKDSIMNSVATASMWANLTAQVVLTISSTPRNLKLRIYIGLVILLAVFVAMIIINKLNISGTIFYYISLVSVALTATATSFISAIFPLVSAINPVLIQAVATGQGIAGTFPAITNIILQLANSKKNSIDSDSTSDPPSETVPFDITAYFCVPLVLSLIGIFSVSFLVSDHHSPDNLPSSSPLFPSIESLSHPSSSSHSSLIPNDVDHHENDPLLSYSLSSSESNENGTSSQKTQLSTRSEWSEIIRYMNAVFQSSYPYMIAVFVNFMITLALYPTLTLRVESTSNFTLLTSVHFLIFNVADFLGKLLPGYLLLSARFNMIFSYSRIVFLPILFFCNIYPNTRKLVVLFDDWMFLVVIFLFGLSNGYVGTCLLMHAPQNIMDEATEKKRDAEIAQSNHRASWSEARTLTTLDRQLKDKAERQKKELYEQEQTEMMARKVSEWMVLCVVSGLAMGSVLSFSTSGIAKLL